MNLARRLTASRFTGIDHSADGLARAEQLASDLELANVRFELRTLRSPLPRPIGPGESGEVALRIEPPDRPGRFTLAIDLVHEHVSWFSHVGAPPMRIAMRVTTK